MNVQKIIDSVRPFSKSSVPRLKGLVDTLRKIDSINLQGDVVECGVWKGANIALVRKVSPKRVCWLFDTFNGMANASEHDVTHKGHRMSEGKAAVSIAEVVSNLCNAGVYDTSYLRFIEGEVETSLTFATNLPKKIALLRLDTDWYHSTRIELEVLYPRLVTNGYLIVDDYGHWMGARKAVDDFFVGARPLFEYVDYSCIIAMKP